MFWEIFLFLICLYKQFLILFCIALRLNEILIVAASARNVFEWNLTDILAIQPFAKYLPSALIHWNHVCNIYMESQSLLKLLQPLRSSLPQELRVYCTISVPYVAGLKHSLKWLRSKWKLLVRFQLQSCRGFEDLKDLWMLVLLLHVRLNNFQRPLPKSTGRAAKLRHVDVVRRKLRWGFWVRFTLTTLPENRVRDPSNIFFTTNGDNVLY